MVARPESGNTGTAAPSGKVRIGTPGRQTGAYVAAVSGPSETAAHVGR